MAQPPLLEKFEARLAALEAKVDRAGAADPRIPLVATGFDVEAAIALGLFDTQEVTGAASQTITFSNIPTSFNNLRVVLFGHSDVGDDQARVVWVQFNGDGGANYRYELSEDGVQATDLAATYLYLAEIDGSTAGREVFLEFTVINYTSTLYERGVLSHATGIQAVNILDWTVVGTWTNTADAVSSITISTGNAATKFDVGSVAWLYGF